MSITKINHVPINQDLKALVFDKSRNKWVASIKAGGKTIYTGRYDNNIEAAIAYNNAAIKYHGEFAKLNIIDENAGRKG